MKARIEFADATKGILDGMFKTEMYLHKSGLDLKLLELIKYRVSQINGCAYCLDMHHKEAIALGETEQRLHSVSAWRECPYYTDKERAVLAYAEAVTNLHQHGLTDELFENLSQHFSKAEIADLTLAVANINSWNRLNISFRTVPGGYKVGQFN
jgi:AhpD family alkylhydroperoxidase